MLIENGSDMAAGLSANQANQIQKTCHSWEGFGEVWQRAKIYRFASGDTGVTRILNLNC